MATTTKTLIYGKIWIAIAALLAITMLADPFVIVITLTDHGPSWLGLDISWQMAMNYVLSHKLLWGNDIIFTYGPLAFLSTRIGLGISRWIFLLFDIFLTLNFFYVFKDFLVNATNKWLALLILICVIVTADQFLGADLAWVLLFFVIYWMHKTYTNSRYAYLTILLILTLITFYIKMNTGLIAVIFIFVHLANLRISSKINNAKLLFVPVMFCFWLYISVQVFHVSLIHYIKGSVEMIKGYNDIMYLNEQHPVIEAFIYIMLSLTLLLFFYRLYLLIKNKQYSQILLPAVSIAYTLLLYKQSTLRNDVQHLFEYISFAPFILLCTISGNKKQDKIFLCGTFAIVLIALFSSFKSKNMVANAVRRITGIAHYAQMVREYNSYVSLNQQSKRYIPERILNKIGQNTIDVYPWDIAYLMENKLNYAPRPVIQSFAAFTERLEMANYGHYLSHSPEYVLYDYDAIDNRYPFNDECMLNMFIGNNYICADTFTSNGRLLLLLQKKTQIAPVPLDLIKTATVSLTKEVDAGHASFLKIDIQYSPAGKMKAIWSKPPQIKITYQTSDGQFLTYKTSKELLHAGIYIGNVVTSNKEFLSYLDHKEQLQPITRIKLEFDSNYYQTKGIVAFYNKISYSSDTNFVTLNYRDLDLQDPNQVFEQNGKKVIAIWGGDIVMKPIKLPPGRYRMTISSNGTAMDGIYPHLNVFADTDRIGSYYATGSYLKTDIYFDQKKDNDIRIKVLMDNDASNPVNKEDRNAFIQYITINKADK